MFGRMRFREVDCPLCSSNHHRSYARLIPDERTILGTGIDEIIYGTCECGFIFQRWPMTPETLAEYYKYQYREFLGTAEVAKKNIKEETARADSIIEFLDGEIVPNDVLDVGSSTGLLLEKLQNIYGCRVVGIEPGDKFREYSQNHGLSVLSDIEYLNGHQKFDMVTIVHVLEHLVEPMALLEKVRGLIAEDGKLLVEVPLENYRLAHPVVFTEETFRTMLNKANFAIEKLAVSSKNIRALSTAKEKAWPNEHSSQRY